MRAKLGGRYAKYAKVSNSTELPKSTLLKPENNKSPKANPKQERNASLDEGNIKSNIEWVEREPQTYIDFLNNSSFILFDFEEEEKDAEAFIAEQTLSSISAFVEGENSNDVENTISTKEQDKLLMPPPKEIASHSSPLPIGLGLKDTIQEYLTPSTSGTDPNSVTYDGKIEKKLDLKNFARYSEIDNTEDEGEELDLTGIDDDEIDGYLMSPEGKIS